MSRWMRRLFARPTRPLKIRNPRLRLLSLEERAVPTVFTVTNANDGGAGSLRQALLDAAADVNVPHTVNFDTVTFGSATTITLTTGQLVAGLGGVTINGPGANLLTIKQTTVNSRVMLIDNGNAATADTYVITGLTFTGGSVTSTATTDRGAGIGIGSESVTLTNCIITANSGAGSGGGIASFVVGSTVTAGNSSTTLTINDSEITNNTSGSSGGGLRLTADNVATISNTKISGNTATTTGGGVYAYRAASVAFTGGSIESNRALTSAGGFRFSGATASTAATSGGPVSFSSTKISGNTAAGGVGGAMYIFRNPGTMTFTNVTISNNSASTSAGGLRISGAGSSTATPASGDVSITGSTISGNIAGNGNSGALDMYRHPSNLTIDATTITNNTASLTGGVGRFLGGTTTGTFVGGAFNITNSNLSGNSAGGNGGTIYAYRHYGALTFTNTTIAGNTAAGSGAGAGVNTFNVKGQITFDRVAVVNNRALNGVADGGGLRFNSPAGTDTTAVATPVLILNSTIAGNSCQEYGGGVSMSGNFRGSVSISYSTIANNTAELGGGGVHRTGFATGAGAVTVTLDNSVVSGNFGGTHPDAFFSPATTVDVNNAVVGIRSGFIISSGTLLASAASPIRLGILSNNGGPSLTMLPAPSSVLVNAGTGTPPSTDQRGQPRVGSADIGAVETSGTEVVPVLESLGAVEAPGASTLTAKVTYYATGGINSATVDATDLVVTGPSPVTVTVSKVTNPDGSITATYLIAPTSDGSWDTADNGAYTVSLAANAVSNAANTSTSNSGSIGTVAVNVGSVFNVTSLAGSGAGSFADALAAAQAGTAGLTDLITFSPSLFVSGAQSITLASALTINDNLFIRGPGRDLLAIRTNGTDRVLIVNDGTTVRKQVYITDVTIRDGVAPAGTLGGGIQVATDNLTLRNARLTNNTASGSNGHGGGLAMTTIGGSLLSRVNIENSEIIGNRSIGTSSDAAGIYSANSTYNQIRVINSLIANNTAGRAGGGIWGTNFALLVESSLISGNTASGNLSDGGGGIAIYAGSRSVDIRNSTITGNRNLNATTGGGGIAVRATGNGSTVFITNSTIAGNTAAGAGGGIAKANTTLGYIGLINTIVDGNGNNGSGGGPDIAATVLYAQNSLISNSASIGFDVSSTGNVQDVSAQLTPLYGFGGATKTFATLPGSPARDAGAVAGPAFDQRGPGYSRANGPQDMGALELAVTTPVATSAPAGTVSTKVADYQFSVTYYDDTGINLSSINGDEILVTGPGGYSKLATVVGVPTGSPTAYTVTYSAAAPSGTWDIPNNGEYTVTLLANSVSDSGAVSAPLTIFGSFTVFIPPSLVVTHTGDSGTGSLRQAVLDASKVIGGATVTFDPGVFSSAQTITLTSGEIPVTGNIVVQGQGANLTSVTGTGNQRVFNVVNPTDTITFTIRDLTFRNTRIFGANNDGGAITVDSENLVLERVNFFNNIADGDGGAVNVVNGTFTWTDGVASGNQTASDIGDGGFLRLNGTTATITRSTISGNTAFDAGGAIYASTASSITLDRSTISGNVAGPGETSSGGGIYLLGTSNISVINSTISGNRAGISGGGIRAGTGTITLVGATVVNNSAGSEGGGLFGLSGNGIIVNDTVVANNLSGLGSGNDVRTDGFVNGDKSVFGDTLGFTNDTTTLTLVAVGQPVLLGPLTNNGGPTQTHLPAFGSPLRNAGNSTLTVDQAGTARPIGGSPDIGSVESSGTAPVGVVTPLTDINATGSASYTVTVRFYDDGVISGIDGNDVRITGPNGFNVLATASKQTPIANGVEVEYQFAPPSGAWAPANAGVYTVSLEAGQVTDGTTPVTAATFGQFRVNLARTFTVTNTNDSGAGSLRQAVLDANAIVGVDTITFDSVTFGSAQTITLTSGDLNAYDGLKVQGPGRNLLTLSTTGYDRHWHVSGLGTFGVEINDMTLANGRLNGTNTTHDIGGSIMVRDESVTVNRVDFVNNRAAQNGGVFNFIQAGVVGAFNDCTFTGNIAGDGGAIRVAANGTITVTNGVFTGNTATNAGGAISNVGGMVVVNGGSITANTANNVGVLGGGGVYNNNTAATTTLTNVAISGNTARLAGGGVFLGTGTLSLDSVTLTANTAASTGGGVYVTSGLFTMNNSTLTNNSSALGGGLVVTGNNGSPLVISKTTFQGNASGDAGGAIYVSANAAILQISDSLFAANTAVGNGGAIRQNDASTIEITNSTGSGNKANLGGGFHSVTAGTLKIFNSTIAYNTAGATGGGGIRMVSGVTELTNTIVSNNTSTNGADISTVSPFFVTTDRVLVSDSIGFTENPLTPTIFADAQLNPLANNGGPTQTHSLKVGSPAIDAGTNSLALSFDQRGQGRTYDDPLVTNAAGGDGTDIGAYEGQLASAAKVTSIVINNGAAQRSRVTTLKVNFDTPVTIANPNNAFTLNRVTPSAGSVTLNTVLDGSGLFATITFTGGLVDGAPGNYSIQDGRYTLTIVPAEFGGAGVDGNSGVLTSNNYNSTPYVDGSTPATGIFRLFGDGSGNGKVESDDFLAFRLAFLSSNDAFDFDGNGQVASPDFLSFRLNFLDQIV